MSEMSNDFEALQRAQQERARMKANQGEGVASALLEGQQEGVADARQAREAEHAASLEKIRAELKVLQQEVAKIEAAIAQTEAEIQQTQSKIAEGGPSAMVHEKVLEVRQKELVGLQGELAQKQEELNDTTKFIELSQPGQLQ